MGKGKERRREGDRRSFCMSCALRMFVLLENFNRYGHNLCHYEVAQMMNSSYFLFSSLLLLLLTTLPMHSLLHERLVHCELEALKIGTRLADIYNGPIEDEEWDQRVHQELLMEHLGFAPWMANGVFKSGGKTPKGISTSLLREKGGWAGRSNVSESPYWALADSWLYLMGDSTTRYFSLLHPNSVIFPALCSPAHLYFNQLFFKGNCGELLQHLSMEITSNETQKNGAEKIAIDRLLIGKNMRRQESFQKKVGMANAETMK